MSLTEEVFKTTCPFSMPSEIPASFVGTVKLLRKFNSTPGSSNSPAVGLTVASLAVPAEISLNQSLLATVQPAAEIQLPITEKLELFNQLEISLSLDKDISGVLLGEVVVAIES